MKPLAQLLRWIRRRTCRHEFRLDALRITGSTVPTERVSWPCAKCGRVFVAHCGLDISPEHGPIVPNSSALSAPSALEK
jgi:hypothetical protein